LDDDPEWTPSSKASCTLTTIIADPGNKLSPFPATTVADFGDYKRKLRYFHLLWICSMLHRRVGPTRRTSRDAVDDVGLVNNASASTRLCCSQVRRRCVLCQWLVIITRLYYSMVYFMDKLAEFVCRTVQMLYETKTQHVGEFT